MLTNRTIIGVRRNRYVMVIEKTIFRNQIVSSVRKAEENRVAIVKIVKELFLVVIFTNRGSIIRMENSKKKIYIFSKLLQLFQRFKNISIIKYFSLYIYTNQK
jgi:histidinol phosphatase-like enzyme